MEESRRDARTTRGEQCTATSGWGPLMGWPARHTILHGTSHMLSSLPASTCMMAMGRETGSSGVFLENGRASPCSIVWKGCMSMPMRQKSSSPMASREAASTTWSSRFLITSCGA
jgi:hypothetical protein